MKFLTSGKVKDIYEVEDGNLLFKFSNRVSAYDVKFKDEIPRKGEVLCKFAEYWFKKLDVSNHFVERRSDTEIVVKKIHMLPIECIVRGYFYGSLFSRWENGKISLDKDTPTDLKLEFGKLNDEIILADSIGPDEFRLWPKNTYKIGKTQEAFDKQLLRDWLTENGYQKKFEDTRLSGEEPIAPSIPSDLISKMTQRYVSAYERMTEKSL